MSNRYDLQINISGLEEFARRFAEMPDIAMQAGRFALNKTAVAARKMSADEILRQINFGASYLSGEDNQRLKVQKSVNENLRAEITARKRPTSLARFATDKNTGRRGSNNPVRINVKGRIKTGISVTGADRATTPGFLINLKRGDLESGNIGLVVRLKEGERIRGTGYQAKPFGKHRNLYLVYGPSVDQVFGEVRLGIVKSGRIPTMMASEFSRQFKRLSNV